MRIDFVTAARPTGEIAFQDLSWTMRDGETWAIVGPIGSGKTSLTDLLLGRLRVAAGSIAWPFIDRLRASGRPIAWPAEVIGRVAFKEESRLFSYGKHYYQQRFNFIEPQDDLTLDEFLHAGTNTSEAELAEMTRRLELTEQRSLSFIKLSNGQARRARIAKALLTRPEIVILDEPFVGLDADGRHEVQAILRQLVADGVRLILIASPEQIPDCVDHVLAFENGHIVYDGPRSGFQPPSMPCPPGRIKSAVVAETIVEMRHVHVAYGGKPILRDVTWNVRAGERWAVLGPNGSGKTTLLSLICGDHPQAYGNEVYVFGCRRGSGESIWDVKRRIGLMSPELHLYFTEPLSAEQRRGDGFLRHARPASDNARTGCSSPRVIRILRNRRNDRQAVRAPIDWPATDCAPDPIARQGFPALDFGRTISDARWPDDSPGASGGSTNAFLPIERFCS